MKNLPAKPFLTVMASLLALVSGVSAVPVNDDFDSAVVLSGFPVTASGSNMDATQEVDEPQPGAGDGTDSIWFEWTPSVSGPVQIDTMGSDGVDTVLAVWTGTDVAALTQVAVNDDYFGSTSAVFFDVTASVSYKIAVYSYHGGDGGDISLHVRTPTHLTGTVTGPDGTTPLEGIRATAYGWDNVEEFWISVSGKFTEADGSYDIAGLPPGTYRIVFNDPGGVHLPEVYDNVPWPWVSLGEDVVLGEGATASGIDASLEMESKISGTVTGSDGTTPLGEISADVFQWDGAEWNFLTGESTLSDGSYSIGGLSAGTYRLRFRDGSGQYLTEYYDDAAALDGATDIVVGTGVVVSGNDASLAVAAKITGSVTGEDEFTPLENITATVYRWNAETMGWDGIKVGHTGPDGAYTVAGLAAGTYRVGFHDGNGTYLSEYYDDIATLDAAEDIEVADAAVVSGINASLAGAGRISGSVTGPGGVIPLQGAVVYAYVWDTGISQWVYTASSMTQADGSYSIGGLAADTYRVQFQDMEGLYQVEWYDDVTRVDLATDIPVAAAETVTGIDASLAIAARIQGVVTGPGGSPPLAGVLAIAYQWNPGNLTWETVVGVYVGPDGSYDLSLDPGTYRIGFIVIDGDLISEFYDDVPTLETAADVVLPPSTVVTGIDASLASSSWIKGTVTGPDGVTALEGIKVNAIQWNPSTLDWDLAGSAETDGNGDYEIPGLRAGTFRVFFVDEFLEYLPEYYDDSPTFEGAVDLVLEASETREDIDASLAMTGRITGTVTGPDGTTALEDIEVEAYLWDPVENDWYFMGFATTGADGTYSVSVLVPGTYRLGFLDANGVHASEYFNDTTFFSSATGIVADYAEVVTGINASLSVGSHISGTVTAADGTTPLQNVGVSAYRWNPVELEWEVMSGAGTDEGGNYSLEGLSVGIYRVRFDGYHADHGVEYYDDSATIALADDIVVGVASTVTGIDASLAEAGQITGTVTGPDGTTPLEGILVKAYHLDDIDGHWHVVESDGTAADGSYAVGSLSPGSYRISFEDASGDHAMEYYQNVSTLGAGLDVVVTSAGTTPGIDASLATTSQIHGMVTAANGGAPLGNIFVTAYLWDTSQLRWKYAGSSYSCPDGCYTIRGIGAGTYRVGFDDDGLGVYIDQYYHNAPTVATATDIGVTASGTTDFIDAALVAGDDFVPVITGLTKVGAGAFNLQFSGVPGRQYQLQESTTLSSWADVGMPFTSLAGGNVIPKVSAAPKVFWRVRTVACGCGVGP